MGGVTLEDQLPYPGNSDELGKTPLFIQQLAEAVQNALTRRRQTGAFSAPGATFTAGQGQNMGTVTFPHPFDSIPRVLITANSAPGGSSTLVPRAVGVTTTGFSLYLYNCYNTSITLGAGWTLAWHAEQDTL